MLKLTTDKHEAEASCGLSATAELLVVYWHIDHLCQVSWENKTVGVAILKSLMGIHTDTSITHTVSSAGYKPAVEVSTRQLQFFNPVLNTQLSTQRCQPHQSSHSIWDHAVSFPDGTKNSAVGCRPHCRVFGAIWKTNCMIPNRMHL